MLLLASASPARRRLLEQAAIPHRVMVSGIDEEVFDDPDPRRLVLRLAEAKALAVAERVGPGWHAPDGCALQALLACDSVLSFDGEVFGKPRDAMEAIARWRRLAGCWAELHTGHWLMQPGDAAAGSAPIALGQTVTTRLLLAPLGEEAIQRYVASGEPLACAGGFALEGRGGLLVERIDGCCSNVIGLSLPLLRQWLPDLCLQV
jgi:septum formation protein